MSGEAPDDDGWAPFRRVHERAAARALLIGSVVGGLGGLSGAASAQWQRYPHVLRNALITGATLFSFSSGATIFTEVFRGYRDGYGRGASLWESFVIGSLWGGVVGRGALGIRHRSLPIIALYLGGAFAFTDYCFLKLLSPQRMSPQAAPNLDLEREKVVERDRAGESRDETRKVGAWWSWLPVVGHRAKRIDELLREIEELSAGNKGLGKN